MAKVACTCSIKGVFRDQPDGQPNANGALIQGRAVYANLAFYFTEILSPRMFATRKRALVSKFQLYTCRWFSTRLM